MITQDEIDARVADIDQAIIRNNRACSEFVSRLEAEKTELLEVKGLLTKDVAKLLRRLEKLDKR